MARVWIGRTPLTRAVNDAAVELHGESDLCRRFGRLLKLARVVDAARERDRLRPS